jgi:Fe-S cluster assembly protein SufB
LPADIKNTYDKLGIPEAEKQRLIAGVAAQYESEVVYHKIRDDLEAEGVLFLDTDTALREHPDLFREYFATVIPVGSRAVASPVPWPGLLVACGPAHCPAQRGHRHAGSVEHG